MNTTSIQGTYLDELKKIVEEIGNVTSDNEILNKLTNAKQLIKKLSTINSSVLSKFRLDGQVGIVTGGGQGIGKALAIALGEAGCKVAVADINLDFANSVVKELQEKGIESEAFKVDVSKKSDVEQLIESTIKRFGDLHIACNNAGIVFNSASEHTTEEEWKKTMDVNLNGVFYCCQAEAKHMLKKGYGRIINTASMSATIVNHPQKQVAYNASKAGVVHMSKTLGSEWCSRGVLVNSLSPGYINTPINSKPELMSVRQKWIDDTPLGRIGEVEDLVGAVLYLASPLASFTTGLDLIVDGGFTCW